MKIYFTLLFYFAFIAILGAQSLTVDGMTYHVDTLENHQVGPGTQYVSLRLQNGSNRMDVFILKSDLKNQWIDVRTALGRDSIYTGEPTSSLAKRKTKEGAFYFAGTNGDFYDTSLPYVGYPVAGSIVDSEIAKIPNSRNVFVMDVNKKPGIGIVAYSGFVKHNDIQGAINSVNHLRGDNSLVLYNHHNGKYTRTNAYGTEVLVELMDGNDWGVNKNLKAKVLKKEKNIGSMAIPKGMAVLSGHGVGATFLNNINVDDEVEISLGMTLGNDKSSNYTLMTGGDNYATMLKNGIVETSSVWNEKHPRTGLGYSQNNDSLIFCVVDGRSASVGATTKQLAEIMKSAGAYTAFNMDGGGSSSMYVAEYGGPVNKTSDGTERAVANSIYLVATSPDDVDVKVVKPYKSSVALPYLGEFVPKFYGYNQYEVLLDTDLKGVTLSCPSSLGKIEGNKFIASGSEPGFITVSYKGEVKSQIHVNFLPVSDVKIRLDSVIVDNRSDYPVEVEATTAAGVSLIASSALSWRTENEEICLVNNGSVKALNNGTTKVFGTINGKEAELIVNVQIPAKQTIAGDSLKQGDWAMSASSFLKAQLNTENLPQSWSHGLAANFKGAAGRAPALKFSNKKAMFGLPDTIKLVMNIGDLPITRAIFSLQANNDTKTLTKEFNNFAKNSDFSLDIPVSDLYNINDRAIYPIRFDNVNFYLDASALIVDKNYTLALKEIALSFKDYVISNVITTTHSDFFHVFPNPVVSGELSVKLKESKDETLFVKLIDTNGKVVCSEERANINMSQFQISTKNLNPGLYILQIDRGTNHGTVKVIVR